MYSHRKVQLLLRSVQMNARMQNRVKGVFTISLLKKLVKIIIKFENGQVYKTVFLVAFFFFSVLPRFCKTIL